MAVGPRSRGCTEPGLQVGSPLTNRPDPTDTQPGDRQGIFATVSTVPLGVKYALTLFLLAGLGLEGEAADLVDDQDRVAAEAGLPASAIACRQHAEFVALGVGKHGPRGFRLVLADVDAGCPPGQQCVDQRGPVISDVRG
jgi:hypothetical protein